ncbi:hypothetical protein ACFSKU_03750 [Pontibacter silvestris]|uniref:Uncharacterized protein n=1 Tax=Pontibacter silvestris TaxID=2305183 RepID=A0ABW4WUV9_9BACT|nr:hypothetical protein [Pontibacter silvestris]MCC9138024.1 hypothetical protein [Pontibacter silvestris]
MVPITLSPALAASAANVLPNPLDTPVINQTLSLLAIFSFTIIYNHSSITEQILLVLYTLISFKSQHY